MTNDAATIAQAWEEFKSHSYPKETPLTLREYRVCFYSGFHAALSILSVLGAKKPTREQTLAVIESHLEEWRRFAAAYLAERQREG